MRVIAGELGGRYFCPPADKWPTRPTTEVSREALYNILKFRLHIPDIHFLDLFGGTGAHTYECISRGCRKVSYVDKFAPCHQFVSKTLREFDIEEYVGMYKMDVIRFIKNHAEEYQYIFAGPPYPWPHIPELPNLILDNQLLSEDGILVVEHNGQHNFEGHNAFVECRNYGQTHFSFFERE